MRKATSTPSAKDTAPAHGRTRSSAPKPSPAEPVPPVIATPVPTGVAQRLLTRWGLRATTKHEVYYVMRVTPAGVSAEGRGGSLQLQVAWTRAVEAARAGNKAQTKEILVAAGFDVAEFHV